jgi:twitching motility protein PilT
MRDLASMQIAMTLAETGHLTFSTLHTGEASQTITRIIDSFPPHQQAQIRTQLAVSLEGIVAQKLLPRAKDGGRVAVFEVLICTRAVKNLIREGKTHQIQSAIQTGLEEGMMTLNASLAERVAEGLIDYETAHGAAWDKAQFAEKHRRQAG